MPWTIGHPNPRQSCLRQWHNGWYNQREQVTWGLAIPDLDDLNKAKPLIQKSFEQN